MELTYERELRKVETEVSENMMAGFARELHDNVGHTLTCMRLTLENKKLDSPELETMLQPVEEYLDEATNQLRMLSRSLNTDYVSNIGLKAAVRLETARVQQLKRHNLHLSEDEAYPELDKNQELIAFRIFQEMMQNTLKHSRAKNIYVSLNSSPELVLTVADDGRGFDASQVLQSEKASGLRNMQTRAKLAGMSFEVRSEPGKGCKYRLASNTL